jgi:hypothetical protein
VYKFPFDKQTCPISLTSWALTSAQINFKARDNVDFELDYYTENPSWFLDDVPIEIKKSSDRYTYFYSNLTQQQVDFGLKLTRKPLYFMMNGVFPCFILNVLTLLAFALPNTCN